MHDMVTQCLLVLASACSNSLGCDFFCIQLSYILDLHCTSMGHEETATVRSRYEH